MTEQSETFSELDIDLDNDTKLKLVDIFVNTRLDLASKSAYEEAIKSGETVEIALLHAVLNEMIIEALRRVVDEQKTLINIADDVDGGTDGRSDF